MTTKLHLAMHGVAIKKHCTAEDITALVGLPGDVLETELAYAQESGRVLLADGRYMLSPAGQMILLGEYSRFYHALRGDENFVSAYEQFEIINNDLKTLITDWQTIEIAGKRVPNDHSDTAYDDEIIGRLGDLHERFEPVLGRLITGNPRLKFYQNALSGALERAEDGAHEWVSDAKIESYHTVWFEMHEDLLRLLGREREE